MESREWGKNLVVSMQNNVELMNNLLGGKKTTTAQPQWGYIGVYIVAKKKKKI